MAFTDGLWGGMLTGLDFDPVSHECQLRVELLENRAATTHVLRCRGVTELRFFNEIEEPWTYAEVTEIDVGFDNAANRWRLEMTLWSEQSGLVLRCMEIALDDEPQAHS